MMRPVSSPSTSVKQPQIRSELVQFVEAAERVLSPALHDVELTPDECDLIAMYVENLSQARHPWGKSLRIKYA